MPDSFYRPAETLSITTEIKKSRFIATIGPAQGLRQARQMLAQEKAGYANANHHCWAYIAGAPWQDSLMGSSDDGEPSGTAGRPMLAQLRGSELGEVCVVVSRFFGGVKLGTGGLVKAYAGAVRAALARLPVTQRVITQPITLQLAYGDVALVESLVHKFAGSIGARRYDTLVHLDLAIASSRVSDFCAQLQDTSAGRVRCPTPRYKKTSSEAGFFIGVRPINC